MQYQSHPDVQSWYTVESINHYYNIIYGSAWSNNLLKNYIYRKIKYKFKIRHCYGNWREDGKHWYHVLSGTKHVNKRKTAAVFVWNVCLKTCSYWDCTILVHWIFGGCHLFKIHLHSCRSVWLLTLLHLDKSFFRLSSWVFSLQSGDLWDLFMVLSRIELV